MAMASIQQHYIKIYSVERVEDLCLSENKEKENFYWSELSFYKIFVSTILFSGAVLFADKKNYLFLLISQYGIREIFIGASFCIVLVMLCLVRRHPCDLLKMPCGNSADAAFIFSLFSCILIFTCEMILEWFSLYKIILLLLVMIISIFVIIKRYKFCKDISIRIKQDSNRNVDLGRLLSDEATEYEFPLVFSEEASEYDLLGREG